MALICKQCRDAADGVTTPPQCPECHRTVAYAVPGSKKIAYHKKRSVIKASSWTGDHRTIDVSSKCHGSGSIVDNRAKHCGSSDCMCMHRKSSKT